MRKLQQQGFTLIELLVVIAIIGVLAAIVLIAINPLEQINRGIDASAKNNVSSVGNSAQAYYTAIGAGGSPTYARTQSIMVTAGDMKSTVLPEPSTAAGGYCAGSGNTCLSGATDCQSGGASVCGNMIAYAKTVSQQSVTLANNAGAGAVTTCTTANTYFAYTATLTTTKAGWYCGPAAPGPGATVF